MKFTSKLIPLFLLFFFFASGIFRFFQNGFCIQSFFDFFFLLLLAFVSYSDFKTLIIPDFCSILIALLGFLSLFFHPQNIMSHLLGILVISLPMLLISLIFDGFGGGDIKLCAACGFYLGTSLITFGALFATLLAACYAILLLVQRRTSSTSVICFGPFLAIGFTISLLFGPLLVPSYLILLQ